MMKIIELPDDKGVFIHAGNYQKRDLLDAFCTFIKNHGEFDPDTGLYTMDLAGTAACSDIEEMVNGILRPYIQ